MAKVFNVIIERDAEGYYVASVPELHGCHTQARSLDTLMERIREAIELCLEVEGEEAPSQEFIEIVVESLLIPYPKRLVSNGAASEVAVATSG